MLQLELATRHAEGRPLLEEFAELLHLLPKGITLAPDLNSLCLLKRRQLLTPAGMRAALNSQVVQAVVTGRLQGCQLLMPAGVVQRALLQALLCTTSACEADWQAIWTIVAVPKVLPLAVQDRVHASPLEHLLL